MSIPSIKTLFNTKNINLNKYNKNNFIVNMIIKGYLFKTSFNEMILYRLKQRISKITSDEINSIIKKLKMHISYNKEINVIEGLIKYSIDKAHYIYIEELRVLLQVLALRFKIRKKFKIIFLRSDKLKKIKEKYKNRSTNSLINRIKYLNNSKEEKKNNQYNYSLKRKKKSISMNAFFKEYNCNVEKKISIINNNNLCMKKMNNYHEPILIENINNYHYLNNINGVQKLTYDNNKNLIDIDLNILFKRCQSYYDDEKMFNLNYNPSIKEITNKILKYHKIILEKDDFDLLKIFPNGTLFLQYILNESNFIK